MTTISKTFANVKSAVLNVATKVLPIVCGVPDDILSSTNSRYIVTIHAKDKDYDLRVNAFLQDNFKLDVNSTWERLGMPPGFKSIGDWVQAGMQATTGQQLKSNVFTRRVWSESTPITIDLRLHFESMNDTFSEVIRPCMSLQSLVLPRRGLLTAGSNSFSLIPPGPNPGKLDESNPSIAGILLGRDGTITINIGQFIRFSSVIIESVSVNFGTKMSRVGPVSADANVRISTYEMLLQEDLAEAYGVTSSLALGGNATGALGVQLQ